MTYAVIRGDIVSSSIVCDPHERSVLYADLEKILTRLTGSDKGFFFFRGDSFYALFSDPENALKYATMIRTDIKASSSAYLSASEIQAQKKPPLLKKGALSLGAQFAAAKTYGIDIRIGIGTGTIDHDTSDPSIATGKAYDRADAAFKTLGRTKRLAINTGHADADRLLNAAASLIDGIITSRMTMFDAATTFYRLRDAPQGKLSARFKTAGWPILCEALQVAEKLLKPQTPTSNNSASPQ